MHFYFNRERQKKFSSIVLQTFVVIFGVFSLAFLLTGHLSGTKYSANAGNSVFKSDKINESKVSLSFESSSASYGVVKSNLLLPWDLIIEPSKSYNIKLSSFSLNGEEQVINPEKYSIVWAIGSEEYYGPEFQIILSAVGVMKGSIKIFRKSSKESSNSDLELLHSQEISVAVKYVRREIRSLTDKDREAVLSALHKMYSLSQEEGRNLYGNAFLSAETILLTHLTSAG